MPYTACIQPHDTFLKIKSSGTLETYEELADFTDLLTRVTEEYGVKRVLLDERLLRKHLDVLDIYNSAESEATAEAAARGVRVACLPNPQELEFSKSVETILHNRSINYRVFLDLEEAEAWLVR